MMEELFSDIIRSHIDTMIGYHKKITLDYVLEVEKSGMVYSIFDIPLENVLKLANECVVLDYNTTFAEKITKYKEVMDMISLPHQIFIAYVDYDKERFYPVALDPITRKHVIHTAEEEEDKVNEIIGILEQIQQMINTLKETIQPISSIYTGTEILKFLRQTDKITSLIKLSKTKQIYTNHKEYRYTEYFNQLSVQRQKIYNAVLNDQLDNIHHSMEIYLKNVCNPLDAICGDL
jgi:RNA processing factor Prp31